MIIVVDAYNLLRATPPYKKTITDKERKHFIANLSAYGRAKGHKIIIVFDGGPHEWPFKENFKIVQVVYSGIHESADDYIKEYIEAHKEKDLLLVSSDSELNRFAQHRNIASIDSSSFAGLLREGLMTQNSFEQKSQNEIIKLNQDKEFRSDAQQVLDKLMTEASKKVFEKSEDFAQVHKKDKQLSKQDRALLQKLKKL